MMYSIWLDDIRPAPIGFLWCHSVNEAKSAIVEFIEAKENALDEWDFPDDALWNYKFYIDLDHDLGDYAKDGGDAIKLIDWLEETGYGSEGTYGIHTANPVGRQNMLNIMIKNGWEVVK